MAQLLTDALAIVINMIFPIIWLVCTVAPFLKCYRVGIGGLQLVITTIASAIIETSHKRAWVILAGFVRVKYAEKIAGEINKTPKFRVKINRGTTLEIECIG